MTKYPTTTFIELKGLYEKIGSSVKENKITFLSAPIGFGKTVTTRKWLEKEKKSFDFLSVFDENFLNKTSLPEKKKNHIVVIDDIYALTDEEDRMQVIDFIARSTCKFIVLSRIDLPTHFKPFYSTRQLGIIDEEDLSFTADDVSEMLRRVGENKTTYDVAEMIMDRTRGWPIAVDFFCQNIHEEKNLDTITHEVKEQLYKYLDLELFSNWDRRVQIFLMSLCLFDFFSPLMATMVTGKREADLYLKELSNSGKFLFFTAPDKYFFEPFFRGFLKQKMKETFSEEQTKYVLKNAGLFYELESDYSRAMQCYDEAGDTEKLSELLITNSRRNAVDAKFYDTERYYRKLPTELILQSPELMCAMSMLESMYLRPEESEKWYNCLVNYRDTLEKSNMNYKLTKEKILYLDIALPHRGSKNVFEILKSAAQKFIFGKYTLQDIAITGNMPSVLNGGKDFSTYAKDARKIGKFLKKPAEMVMGKAAIGTVDAGVGEALFEISKEVNYTDALACLNTALSETIIRGNLQTQFAIVGIMSRAFIAQGSIDTAANLIENFKEKCVESNFNFLVPNIESLMTRINLFNGELYLVEQWMNSLAPQEGMGFVVPRRYQYLTKVRCYIMYGRYLEAASLLNLLKSYYETYGRTYGVLETEMLYSIVLYRIGDERWNDEFIKVIRKCEEQGFTRLIADEGLATYELLKKITYDGDKKFYNTLMHLTREQALKYPEYLVGKKKLKDELSASEQAVLKLVAQGKKNEEIADFLCISVSTVKFHIGKIFNKLEVNSRAQAIKVGAELNLI